MARLQKITIRLNDIENKAIREMAENNQISVSEYIRNLVCEKGNPEYDGGTTTPPYINNQ